MSIPSAVLCTQLLLGGTTGSLHNRAVSQALRSIMGRIGRQPPRQEELRRHLWRHIERYA